MQKDDTKTGIDNTNDNIVTTDKVTFLLQKPQVSAAIFHAQGWSCSFYFVLNHGQRQFLFRDQNINTIRVATLPFLLFVSAAWGGFLG